MTASKYRSRSASSGTDSELLAFSNSPETTLQLLDRVVGLRRPAAEHIIRDRDGPDGQPGTVDAPFDTIAELNAVPFVGPATLRMLRAFVARR